jgi:hypothetical protein
MGVYSPVHLSLSGSRLNTLKLIEKLKEDKMSIIGIVLLLIAGIMFPPLGLVMLAGLFFIL